MRSELGLLIICLAILASWLYTAHGWRLDMDDVKRKQERERESWHIERQQLLDRIQAPSFDHLKQAEIRVIKATNNTPEPPKLEQL